MGFCFTALITVIMALSAACVPAGPANVQNQEPTPELEQVQTTPVPTATPRPSPTPTRPPLGEPGNPVTIGFILLPDETSRIDAAQEIAVHIRNKTGYAVESLFYPDFQTLSTAIMDEEVHLFWPGPLEYLYLNWAGQARVLLMTNHQGVYAYGVQFITNQLDGFTPHFDLETNQSVVNSITALQQFSGTRPCFVHPDSIPGHLVPLGLLAEASTPTLDPVFVYSYNAMIRALYIQGICQFGVSYALTGDPRTSGDILQNLPDAPDQVVIIWQSEGIIPNTNLSVSPELPAHIRFRLEEAFLALPATTEGLSLLSSALDYEVGGLKSVQDNFYNPLRAIIIPLELDLESLTHQ